MYGIERKLMKNNISCNIPQTGPHMMGNSDLNQSYGVKNISENIKALWEIGAFLVFK